jgi:hypothetical protein
MIPQIAEGLGDLMTLTALHAIDSGMKKQSRRSELPIEKRSPFPAWPLNPG